MIKLSLGLALLMASAAGSAQSFTAEQLVAKNLAARGGQAALDAIKSIQFEGRALEPGDFELKFKQVMKRQPQGDAVRMDLTVQGLTLVQAYDGSSGWKINPFAGRRDAERMSADEARSMGDQALVSGVLLGAVAAKSRVTYAGTEDFDGTQAYKLKIVQSDGDEYVYLLDPDTFLEIKTVESRRVRGTLQVTDYELGDYEKVAGVYYPMSIDSWTDGQPNQRQRIVIETATANVDAPASLFAQPADGAKPSAAMPSDASERPPTDTRKAPADPVTPPTTAPKKGIN